MVAAILIPARLVTLVALLPLTETSIEPLDCPSSGVTTKVYTAPLPAKAPLTPPLIVISLAVNPSTTSSKVKVKVTSEPSVIASDVVSVIVSEGAVLSRVIVRVVAEATEVLPIASTNCAVIAKVPSA